MAARFTGRPQDAVLGMELGGERPSSESAVQAVLSQPRDELPVAVKAETREDVADYVVDGPESVESPPGLAPHQGMAMRGLDSGSGDFEESIGTHCRDHLAVGRVGHATTVEHHRDTPPPRPSGKTREARR